MMRSIPGILASGNMTPASTTIMSLPYSSTVMFLPISPTPPSGIIRNWGLGTVSSFRVLEETELLGRLVIVTRLDRLASVAPFRTVQIGGQTFHIGKEGIAQRLLVQSSGRVIHSEKVAAVLFTQLAVDFGDHGAREKGTEREAAQRHDQARIDDFQLLIQPGPA